MSRQKKQKIVRQWFAWILCICIFLVNAGVMDTVLAKDREEPYKGDHSQQQRRRTYNRRNGDDRRGNRSGNDTGGLVQ